MGTFYAFDMTMRGEITAGRLMIRDYINATGSMNDIAAKLKKQKPAIARMLEPKDNPTLKSFIPVVQACADREQIELSVCEGNCSVPSHNAEPNTENDQPHA